MQLLNITKSVKRLFIYNSMVFLLGEMCNTNIFTSSSRLAVKVVAGSQLKICRANIFIIIDMAGSRELNAQTMRMEIPF